MTHLRWILFLLLAATLFGFASVAHATPTCSQKTLDSLEDQSSTMKDWGSIADFYKRYIVCKTDDASVDEGITESITYTLAHRWSTLPFLQSLVQGNDGFRKFVLAGINATGDEKNLKEIKRTARDLCPKDLTAHCTAVGHEADAALREMRKQQ